MEQYEIGFLKNVSANNFNSQLVQVIWFYQDNLIPSSFKGASVYKDKTCPLAHSSYSFDILIGLIIYSYIVYWKYTSYYLNND